MATLTSEKKMMTMATSFVTPILINTTTSALNTQAFNAHAISRCPDDEISLEFLHFMDEPGDSSAYVYLLQASIEKRALLAGKLIHARIHHSGLAPHRYLNNTLVNMYVSCGCLVDARRVFDQMPERDNFSWTVMIAAYARHGIAQEAMNLFYKMQRTDILSNQFTFASVLPACANSADLEKGVEIHEEIIRRGFQCDVVVANALVDMYVKCGRTEIARQVFDKMSERDVVSWTSMIAGYAQNGYGEEVLELFQQMQLAGLKPSLKTFTSVLSACASLAALEQGMEIHEELIRTNFLCDAFLESALIDMYAKCGHMEDACKLFDKMCERDVVSWTVMIAGYAQNGWENEALKLFQQMQLAGVKPGAKAFANILPACANLEALGRGVEIHGKIIVSGFHSDVIVESALMFMYAKCGNIEKARTLFDKMLQRDEVSWTLMIAGYAQNGYGEKALELFQQMQMAGVNPNLKTFASVLPACANLAALEQGRGIHEEIIRSGFQSDIVVENALIDMYAKCGNIEKARELFDKMHRRDVISWTAMISGYAMHGSGKEALELFEQMNISGIIPNHVTLVSVLSACCHAGLVDEGLHYFHYLREHYGIAPAMEHYSCIVDLLGRAGRLDEAQDFISNMPLKPDSAVWSCLLGACRIHHNIELGERVAAHLFELNPRDAAPYVILSNMYATAGRWADFEKVRKVMKERTMKKMPGSSWIEINKQMHAFLVGEESHAHTQNAQEDS